MHSATIFFALAAVVASQASPLVAPTIIAHPAYQSSYAVSDKITGDQKSAVEVRNGGVTKGSYSLVQPDGVLRTVNYVSTPLGGFQAQVVNKGVAGHPAVLGVGKSVIGGVGLAAAPAVVGVGKGVVSGVKAVAPVVPLVGATSVVGDNIVLVDTLGLGLGGWGWGSGLVELWNGVPIVGLKGVKVLV